jgi:hypothetical protein
MHPRPAWALPVVVALSMLFASGSIALALPANDDFNSAALITAPPFTADPIHHHGRYDRRDNSRR